MAELEVLFKQAQTELPGLRLRRTASQEVLELIGVQGIAWRPLSGSQVLQIYPPTKGRKALRKGESLVIEGATAEWRYHDPNHCLKPNQWSYVGCNCSMLPDEQVWNWIRQAYEYLKRDKASHVADSFDVVRVESVYQQTGIGEPLEHIDWLAPLITALQQVPKSSQGKRANELLAEAFDQAKLRFQREVPVGPGSEHKVDFILEHKDDKVGVEFGTGQAERLELDLLKLLNLALSQRITYACLVLPRDVLRHKTMGRQPMKTAVSRLISMCLPLWDVMRRYWKDLLIIWYV